MKTPEITLRMALVTDEVFETLDARIHLGAGGSVSAPIGFCMRDFPSPSPSSRAGIIAEPASEASRARSACQKILWGFGPGPTPQTIFRHP